MAEIGINTHLHSSQIEINSPFETKEFICYFYYRTIYKNQIALRLLKAYSKARIEYENRNKESMYLSEGHTTNNR